MNEPTLERVLRNAPKPTPPRGLKQQLMAQAMANSKRHASSHQPEGISLHQHWLRRWWPTLVPAGFSLFCLVVLAVQQFEIRDLRHAMKELSTTVADSERVSVQAPVAEPHAVRDPVPGDATELQQLQEMASELSREVARLESLGEKNRELRAELAKPVPGAFSPEELAGVDSARERALRMQCMNNMKQLGLAAHVVASQNNDVFPSDVSSMVGTFGSTKILVCPSDTSKVPAESWASFTMANCSYEWHLTPPGREANRVLTRCPFHELVGLYDGSVQGGDLSGLIVNRDGKLFLEREAATPVPLPK